MRRGAGVGGVAGLVVEVDEGGDACCTSAVERCLSSGAAEDACSVECSVDADKLSA